MLGSDWGVCCELVGLRLGGGGEKRGRVSMGWVRQGREEERGRRKGALTVAIDTHAGSRSRGSSDAPER